MTDPTSTRRDFLRATGASLAAGPIAAATASAQAPATAPAKPFGYAIVGLGSLAQGEILPAFVHAKRCRVTALVSSDPSKARGLATQYGVPERGLYSYETFDRIADNPDVDGVYIVLPNGLHAEYSVRASKAGKHVLVEKPMANTVAECDAMLAAAKAAGKHLAVAYRLRFEPYTQAMIKMARDKEYGRTKIVLCDSGFNIGNPEQWRLTKKMGGGGSMMDIGIYSVNAARYLAGEEPTEVFAMETTDRNDPRFKEVEDTLTFQLRFPSGTLANCVSSYGAYLNRFRVYAEKGSFELEPAWSRRGLGLRVFRGNTIESRTLREPDHFAAMMDHLAECAATGTRPLTDGEDGRNDMRVIEACYESVRTGRPVKLG
ncbi:glucose-fructose oxidoreductase [Luteitalea sp. TBR-22]|uniref:Gfo/Idh/MocA family protein n=1 Tax=Luteitalea sp. TBR-22 TaxID=2802971 RepID=UPI001EF4A023|nr:Gfo/Idh/MocA family oxidoreductase [Luteitalea sp. TBR-22]BCS31818.2 glucose-fructose oxidoreductase [Luteitalea sp. TBR-22]